MFSSLASAFVSKPNIQKQQYCHSCSDSVSHKSNTRAFLNAVNAAYAAYAGQETADGTTGATQKNVEQPADSAAPEAVDTLSAK